MNNSTCQPSATTFSVTVRDGHAKTTDGPMDASSSWLNGYFVLDCKDRAEFPRGLATYYLLPWSRSF
jgi:hypothetical protein